MAWAVIQTEDEQGAVIALDVVPAVYFDGEAVVTANHQLGKDCPCHPFSEVSPHRLVLWQHHDPDHAGALTTEEWTARKQAAESAEFARALETADEGVKLPTF